LLLNKKEKNKIKYINKEKLDLMCINPEQNKVNTKGAEKYLRNERRSFVSESGTS